VVEVVVRHPHGDGWEVRVDGVRVSELEHGHTQRSVVGDMGASTAHVKGHYRQGVVCKVLVMAARGGCSSTTTSL
jgi:hypothetical protein